MSHGMQNLIPFDVIPKERHIELSSRGGIKSGETRRRKAAQREALEEMWERAMLAKGFIDDIEAFRRWKKARGKHGRTTRN